MTMSQEEWDRRQAAGDWTQLPAYTPPATRTRPAHPWVDKAIDSATNGNGDGDGRHIKLTYASQIPPKRVRWTWDNRIAAGTIALLAGREGLGKSTIGYWMAARLSRGDLPGEHYGTPKGSLVCATEDSWAHTIVPRLMAHGADLDRIARIEVVYDDEDIDVGLSLPKDIGDLETAALDVDAALLALDPLMSRLDAELDSHKDGQVRRALEPLVSIADRTTMAILGLIHHNKSGSSDPLQLVMASKAFTAVARSVHTVVPDPDDDTGQHRYFGNPKNNLGPLAPSIEFTITGWEYDTDDGPGVTGQIVWGDEVTESIADLIRRGSISPEEKTQLEEACEWLEDYLEIAAGHEIAGKVLAAGKVAGHAERTLQRARKTLKITTSKIGFEGAWQWVLPRRQQPANPVTSPNLGALAPSSPTSTPTRQTPPRRQGTRPPRARGAFEDTKDNEPFEITHHCTRCGLEATDISGLCPACRANPGTLPPRDRKLDF